MSDNFRDWLLGAPGGVSMRVDRPRRTAVDPVAFQREMERQNREVEELERDAARLGHKRRSGSRASSGARSTRSMTPGEKRKVAWLVNNAQNTERIRQSVAKGSKVSQLMRQSVERDLNESARIGGQRLPFADDAGQGRAVIAMDHERRTS